MIRHKSSKASTSMTQNPSELEHLTAAKGISTIVPVTDLNSVNDAVNFELEDDHTLRLRKPLIRKSVRGPKSFYLYDKKSELNINSNILEIIDENDIINTSIILKFTDLDLANKQIEINTSDLNGVIDFSNINILDAKDSTIILGSITNYTALEALLSDADHFNTTITLYDHESINSTDASALTRYLSLYYDTDLTKWILQIVSPEDNTITGDSKELTPFDPNLALDNAYSITDLYKYGSNTVTNVLAYQHKDAPSNTFRTLQLIKDGYTIKVNVEDALFDMQVAKDGLNICISNKEHLLIGDPEAFFKNTDDIYTNHYCGSAFSFYAVLTLTVNNSGTNTTYTYKTRMAVSQLMQAGTVVARFTIPSSIYTSNVGATFTTSANIKVCRHARNLDTDVLSANTTYLSLYGFAKEKTLSELTAKECFATDTATFVLNKNYTISDGLVVLSSVYDSAIEKYGYTTKIIDGGLYVTNRLYNDKCVAYYNTHIEAYYLTVSNTATDPSSKAAYFKPNTANKLYQIPTKQRAALGAGYLTLYCFEYIPTSNYINLLNTDGTGTSYKVKKLTEQVSGTRTFPMVVSVKNTHAKDIVLKALLTTSISSTLTKNSYCLWEESSDSGVTWKVSDDFIRKFFTQLISIPLTNTTSSDESLEESDDYTEYKPMVRFNALSNNDLIQDRPDILYLAETDINKQYRFSIYNFDEKYQNPLALSTKIIPWFKDTKGASLKTVKGCYVASTETVYAEKIPNRHDPTFRVYKESKYDYRLYSYYTYNKIILDLSQLTFNITDNYIIRYHVIKNFTKSINFEDLTKEKSMSTIPYNDVYLNTTDRSVTLNMEAFLDDTKYTHNELVYIAIYNKYTGEYVEDSLIAILYNYKKVTNLSSYYSPLLNDVAITAFPELGTVGTTTNALGLTKGTMCWEIPFVSTYPELVCKVISESATINNVRLDSTLTSTYGTLQVLNNDLYIKYAAKLLPTDVAFTVTYNLNIMLYNNCQKEMYAVLALHRACDAKNDLSIVYPFSVNTNSCIMVIGNETYDEDIIFNNDLNDTDESDMPDSDNSLETPKTKKFTIHLDKSSSCAINISCSLVVDAIPSSTSKIPEIRDLINQILIIPFLYTPTNNYLPCKFDVNDGILNIPSANTRAYFGVNKFELVKQGALSPYDATLKNEKITTSDSYNNTDSDGKQLSYYPTCSIPKTFLETNGIKQTTRQKAYLLSQKTYTFSVLTSDTTYLDRLHINISSGKAVLFNSQLLTYGVPGYENTVFVSNPDSFITSYYTTLDLPNGGNVVKIILWRSYAVIFTEKCIYIASEGPDFITTKVLTSSMGMPSRDADTAIAVLNSVIFKSGSTVYKLYPNVYSNSDSIMNTAIVSSPISTILSNITENANNFALHTNDYYILFIPYITDSEKVTYCFRYNYASKYWDRQIYDSVAITSVASSTLDSIYLYANVGPSTSLTYFKSYYNKDYKDIFDPTIIGADIASLQNAIGYGDIVDIDAKDITINSEDEVDPIGFSIDFGQKSSTYTISKQYLETKFTFGTLSEKTTFPMNITICTDGMPCTISIDPNTDSALFKTNNVEVGTLATSFSSVSSNNYGTLCQMFVKYSGRGKTSRHLLYGTSKQLFKFYSLDAKYRILPKKQ